MALPLLMMAGAGVLGGGQYLLKKMDERRSESLLSDLQTTVATSPAAGTPVGDAVLRQGQRLASDDSLLSRNSGQIESLIGGFENTMLQQQQAQAQQQAMMQDMYSQSNQGIADQLDQDYNRDMRVFSETQNQFRAAMTALENPSNLNSVTTLYNLFNILEPGGRVTANEDGTFSDIGDSRNRFANWLNEWKGEGLTEATRKEIMESIWQQYTPRLEQARARKAFYEQKMRNIADTGRNVQTPIGSLGINWGIQQMPSYGGPAAPAATQLPTPPGMREVSE